MQADAVSHAGPLRSPRKNLIRRLNDEFSGERNRWLNRAAFFQSEDIPYLKFLVPDGLRVLELGCGTGRLLTALKPSFGLGVDISERMITQARKAILIIDTRTN
jgi:ubiquinone/menaquinone biosynthesis C-methylase UbiE